MKFKLVLTAALAITNLAHAGKSAEDCEIELGEAAKDRDLVAACIYAASEGKSLPPPPSANANSIVLDFGIWTVNSVGGVELYVDLSNPNKKSSIKYARMSMTLYNSVGDAVSSSIGGGSTKSISFTGPLAYEDGMYRAKWNPIWYNHSGSCVVMQSLSVEFMNGQKQSYSGKRLRDAIAPDVKNSCKVQ